MAHISSKESDVGDFCTCGHCVPAAACYRCRGTS